MGEKLPIGQRVLVKELGIEGWVYESGMPDSGLDRVYGVQLDEVAFPKNFVATEVWHCTIKGLVINKSHGCAFCDWTGTKLNQWDNTEDCPMCHNKPHKNNREEIEKIYRFHTGHEPDPTFVDQIEALFNAEQERLNKLALAVQEHEIEEAKREERERIRGLLDLCYTKDRKESFRMFEEIRQALRGE